MMDAITTKEAIERKIAELAAATNEIIGRAEFKAKSSAEYDKALAIKIVQLKKQIHRIVARARSSQSSSNINCSSRKGHVF